jgi:phosphatidylglycerol---prolipoprotein diacylglyceryl transferase
LSAILPDWYQYLPLHINPAAFTIGSFSVRWYSISYIVGFIVVCALLIWREKRGEYPEDIDHIPSEKGKVSGKSEQGLHVAGHRALIIDFMLIGFFAAVAAGRIGYVMFYDFQHFLAHPSAIVSPYDSASGRLIGLYGMSYHGALVGVIVAGFFFVRAKKIPFLKLADFIVPAIPAGYFFGRIGNFLNGELYGRVTSSPLGMYFVNDPGTSRHPSQLYEAFLEGMVLFAILWALRNKAARRPGSLFLLYLFGYGCVRFVAEQFRNPDPQLGFLSLGLTMGQILSIAMIASSFFLTLFLCRKQWYTG